MNINAYLYLIRGEEYKFPYEESIKSILPFCNKVHVLTDPRFSDTDTVVSKLERLSSEVIIHQEEFDLDDPGLDGKSKAKVRYYASQDGCDWLYQTDADEIFRKEDIKKIDNVLCSTEDDIISCGVLNWFNGDNIKIDAPWTKERFSRNKKYITHGIPVQFRQEREDGLYYVASHAQTDGAGYIDMGGNSLAGNITTFIDKHNLIDVEKGHKYYINKMFYDSLKKDIWVHHYSWYALPLRWLREATWQYFWGILRGDYVSLEDFENQDGKKIDFFSISALRTSQSYLDAIGDEMRKNSKGLFQFKLVKHPAIVTEWLSFAKTYIYGTTQKRLLRKWTSILPNRHTVIFE
ncbi:MAG: hypothetical protein H8D45_20965 [Bacteroidetes bacterium]|nr:hypothetical protein [Bacteroidota bacterium]